MALAIALALAAGSGQAGPASAQDGSWRDSVEWNGATARMRADGDGWRLQPGSGAAVVISPQPMRSQTASPLFDGLFALAQAELAKAQVEAISDSAYDRGKPIPCSCFETGEKWRYVWTRDLSFAADLALATLRPERTRNALRFKLSDLRAGAPQGTYVVQDTGSGGSWPISSDRVVWFLAARGLVDADASDAEAARFDEAVWHALTDTLAQDRQFVFDADMGLYRGETSFLDWREQSYPRWTADDVAFLAQSFALSTNVLHHEALRLAERMARQRGDALADDYARQAGALATQIERRFWREDRGLYMSYIGTAAHPVPFEAYDLLGLSLLIDSGIAPEARARRALANYPGLEAGSPVIWPQQPGVPIYHNRAIWPFVSAYSLRAARKLDDVARIEHEIRSILRGAALAGSNMENYELVTQAVHVEAGALSGPVVNSPRQLWSVAGYLQMVMEGVFGIARDDAVDPKIPVSLVPMLFGERERISLRLPDREVVLVRPRNLDGDLLVADATAREGGRDTVRLAARRSHRSSSTLDAAAFAPASPDAPSFVQDAGGWRIDVPARQRLYVDGALRVDASTQARAIRLPKHDAQQCASLTRVEGGIESLHSPTRCVGQDTAIAGDWPRAWRAPQAGRYALSVDFTNTHGPINTGITAAVKTLVAQCDGVDEQRGTLVMPHGAAMQRSSAVVIDVPTGAACRFTLRDGVNMSYLAHNARYTGGAGGVDGPINSADIGALHAVPVKDPVR
ncbi:Six-hairpin glycosidase-like protein [Lysobacter arvi]